MIPTINVTPQSPASVSKYSNIFDDTLNQLHNIRENVVKMKNSSSYMYDGFNGENVFSAVLSSSLPDLSTGIKKISSGNNLAQFILWSANQQFLSNVRRKSWTAIDDYKADDFNNKSISLSSLDSEEQENIRLAEQRRRSGRNSTGGISTHSLNEAELVRDFERIATKRNFVTDSTSRIPLQKSISTSSIIAKEDKVLSRHLTDSEDESQNLLRAHNKIQIFDNVEKRRKRGSIFFRRKKEKTKTKATVVRLQDNNFCEYCGINIRYTNKDHQLDCKAKKAYSLKSIGAISKKGSESIGGHDMYDGGCGIEQINQFNDETFLLKTEFYNDVPTDANDLGADPALGIALKEHDSWSPGIPKEVLKNLKEFQIKRQEHIYEFIMTEKHHCQTLLVIQKLFVECIERHFPSLNINCMFPRLSELTELHTSFLKKLREKQRENHIVDSISDILLDFFTSEKAQQLRLAYGEFCANHRTALEQFKVYMTTRDHNFAEWYKHCLTNPLLKKKGIPECILFVTQRLTKYPLLIEPLLKSAKEDFLETEKLQHALNLVKALLVDVDSCVAEKELRDRQIDIYQRIDPKSFAIYRNKPFRKNDISIETKRRLKFEGLATLMQGRSKMQSVLVVVLTDCLCFFCENSAHNKYTFFTPDHKAGVVPLQKLLIREKAGTESRGIYIISSNPAFPEMYELKVQQPKDKNVWIQSIRQAVLECPSLDLEETQDFTAEDKIRMGINKREIIEKMRQKDIEHAILLEEKLVLHYNLIKDHQQNFSDNLNINNSVDSNVTNITNASTFLISLSTYRDLVGVDSDVAELWQHVQKSVQEISQLASTVYSAATGLSTSRSVISVGEKLSDICTSSLSLPKRAETFAGFDEKRVQRTFPSKSSAVQLRNIRTQECENKNDKLEKETPINQESCPSDYNLQNILNIPSSSQIEQKNDPNIAGLQITHHLNTLLCIILQQMTAIHNLQNQLGLYREGSKTVYTHNDQLEELRNLQDRLQEEKTAWLKQKEQQERELTEVRVQQQKVQAQIKAEEEDIKQQREQLYRKMELLSNQGLLLSPNTPLIINSSIIPTNIEECHQESHDGVSTAVDSTTSNTGNTANGSDRRKWRQTGTMATTPPVNLISATNASKVKQTNIKQKIPIKLSSLSSNSGSTHPNKIDKSSSFSSPSTNVVQLFPLKLVDKRSSITSPHSNISNVAASHSHTPTIPYHSRAGSSPAIVQHLSTCQNAKSVHVIDVNTNYSSEQGVAGSSGSHQSKLTYKNAEDSPKPVCSYSSKSKDMLPQEEDEIYF